MILPLVAWGYFERPREWFALLDALAAGSTPVVNPPSVLRWSSDKAYLAELGERGVPTVPTLAVQALAAAHLDQAREQFGTDTLIAKPPISAGAFNTFRLAPGDPVPDAAARPAGDRPALHRSDRGPAANIRCCCSTACSATAWSSGPSPAISESSRTSAGPPSRATRPTAPRRLRSPRWRQRRSRTTYARVDMIRDDAGTLRIMELELVEPALFLDLAPDRGAAFTRSILRAAERSQRIATGGSPRRGWARPSLPAARHRFGRSAH